MASVKVKDWWTAVDLLRKVVKLVRISEFNYVGGYCYYHHHY